MQTRTYARSLATIAGLALAFLIQGTARGSELTNSGNRAPGAFTSGQPRTIGRGMPAEGDILICDVSGPLGLSFFTPATGILENIATAGLLSVPMGVALESSSSAIVSVLGTGIVRVSLVNGGQQVVSAGGLLVNPDGITMAPNGNLYVADLATNSIIAVNPNTGTQHLVTTGLLLSGPIFLTPVGNDSLLVSSHNNGLLVWVRISTGTQSLAANGGNLSGPEGLAIDVNNRAIVVDLTNHKLLSIDLLSGIQAVIASGLPGTPMGLVLDGLGNAYVGNYEHDGTYLTKVNLFTGVKTSIPIPQMKAFGMALVTSLASPPPPAAPTTFVASEGQPEGVFLNWSTVPAANAFRLYRNGLSIAVVGPTDSSYLDVPAVGTYNYCIEALNTGGASPQVCDVGSRRAYRITPDIRFVRDVPNDQGGKLAIAWLRSEYDAPLVRTITGYRIWRRLPVGDAAIAGGLSMTQSAETRTITDGQSISYWEPLSTIPAAFLEGYGIVAASTQDSLPDSNPYTAVFVSALTSDPFVFYDSAIDSGYSVDNLAPLPPAGLRGTIAPAVGITLHWLPNRETDLASYSIYLGPNADFDPSPENRLGSTPDTIFAAGNTSGSYYKVSAVDIHGNESPFSTLAPTDLPTTTLITDIQAESEGASVTVTVGLSRSAANLSAILYRGTSDVFAAATPVPNALTIVTGESVELRDVTVTAGRSYWYWVQLVGSDGLVVLAGPVAVSVGNAPAFTQLRSPEPNPMANQTMLRYALGTDIAGSGTVPCRIEIFTVQGRRVRALENSVRVAGSYEAQWDGKDDQGTPLRGGVYYVRLTAASVRKTCKLVLAR